MLLIIYVIDLPVIMSIHSNVVAFKLFSTSVYVLASFLSSLSAALRNYLRFKS